MASQKKIDSGETGRKSGMEFEDILATEIGGIVMPNKKVDSINGGKTTHKADIINRKENNLLISVKNPMGYSISTQIHVCPLQSLKIYLPTIPCAVETALRAFVGDFPKNHRGREDKENFYSLCKAIGIRDPERDLSPLEKRRFRVDSFSLGEENSNAVINWTYENREALYRFIFQDGIMCSTVTRPDQLWWTQKQNDLKNISRFALCDIISRANNLEKHEVRFNDKNGKNNSGDPKPQTGTVIQIGAVTLQMKGSGKDPSYHYPQFNCSLANLSKMMGDTPIDPPTYTASKAYCLPLFAYANIEDKPSFDLSTQKVSEPKNIQQVPIGSQETLNLKQQYLDLNAYNTCLNS
jgi:hypothetical protein